MHRLFLIAELVDNVLVNISDRSSLAAMAQTATALSSHALDKLWADLPDLGPLIGLFPPTPSSCNCGDSICLPHVQPLATLGWDRLRIMSERVEHLRYHDGEPTYRHFLFLVDSLITQKLFTKLRKLTWRASSRSSPNDISIFLSPSLRSIDLVISSRLEDIRTVSGHLNLLASQSLNLVSFSFSFGCSLEPGPLLDSLTRLLRSAPTLEAVLLPPGYWSDSLGTSLASLPRLSRLGHTVIWQDWESDRVTYYPFSLQLGWFKGLRDLTFDASLESALSMLTMAEALPCVDSLGITTYPHAIPPPIEIRNFLRGLAPSYPHLRRLCLNLQSYPDNNVDLSFEDLSPLLSCQSLRVLCITHDPPVPIISDYIAQMGAAWPEMERLEICQDARKLLHPSQTVPLRLLPMFASNLPNLTELGLFLTTWEPPSPRDGPFPKFAKLRNLKVGSSSIKSSDTPYVAAFLREILNEHAEMTQEPGVPVINGLWPAGWASGESKAGWKEVEKLLTFLPWYMRAITGQ